MISFKVCSLVHISSDITIYTYEEFKERERELIFWCQFCGFPLREREPWAFHKHAQYKLG